MEDETQTVIKTLVCVVPLFLVVVRLIVITPATNPDDLSNPKILIDEKDIKGSVMIFLGSGGHTGEMMSLVSNINMNNLHRIWVVSGNDSGSLSKCKQYEDSLKSDLSPTFVHLHRARSVGEPLLLLIKNTLVAFLDSCRKIYSLAELPSVLLLNGPGTSVPIAYILFLFKFIGLCNTRIIYVESLARVNHLSLSGKLLLPITNRFIVQWPQLAVHYKRAEYYGILV